MNALLDRRTIRKYSEKEVSDEQLKKLFKEAFQASTVGGMQTYSVVVTRTDEGKEKLAPAHFNQPMVRNANVVLTFCVDLRRFTKWCEARDAKAGYDNFQWFVTGAIDAIIAAQTFCVAAEKEGLGICYLGTTTYNPDKIIDSLKLPSLVFPITTITLGYPDETPKISDRLPLEAIVHNEEYHDYTRQTIDALYEYKESLPENKAFVEENKKENLAQVFTDVRYTKEANEAFSKILMDTMKRQGF